MVSHLLRELILPPGCLLLMMLFGAVLQRKQRRAGVFLLVGAWVVFYCLSIPLFSSILRKHSEAVPPLSLNRAQEYGADAIVVLGGGVRYSAPEYAGRTVCSDSSLVRANYGVYLARRLSLPILVAGGYGETAEESEASCMKDYLHEQGFDNVLTETQSRNTFENAKFSAPILEMAGYKKLLLVTSADHALRAQEVFESQGLDVLCAPTELEGRVQPWSGGVLALVPTSGSFDESCRALRAELGLVWYRILYR